MINMLYGYTDEFSKAISDNLDKFNNEDVVSNLEENIPTPTLAAVVGVVVGVAYGISIEDLSTVVDEDNYEELLVKVFDNVLQFTKDNGVTVFDKRD